MVAPYLTAYFQRCIQQSNPESRGSWKTFLLHCGNGSSKSIMVIIFFWLSKNYKTTGPKEASRGGGYNHMTYESSRPLQATLMILTFRTGSALNNSNSSKI